VRFIMPGPPTPPKKPHPAPAPRETQKPSWWAKNDCQPSPSEWGWKQDSEWDSKWQSSSAGSWEAPDSGWQALGCKKNSADDQGWSSTEWQTSEVANSKKRGKPLFHGPRLWCHILLNKKHEDFDLIPMVIGSGGKNTKAIYASTNAKVRIRGKGSGHLEVEGRREAPVPLMCAITSHHADAQPFVLAVQMMTETLRIVSAYFQDFCKQRGIDESIDGEPIWKFGDMSTGASHLLTEQGLLQPAADEDFSDEDVSAFLESEVNTFLQDLT
jgi:hypothetical protein